MKNLTGTQQEQNLIDNYLSAKDGKHDWARNQKLGHKTSHGQAMIAKYSKLEKQTKKALKDFRDQNKNK